VGVIGTGSSAIQAIPVIAEQAASLTVFQRTPQYTMPANNHPLDSEYVRRARENYSRIRDAEKRSFAGVTTTVYRFACFIYVPCCESV